MTCGYFVSVVALSMNITFGYWSLDTGDGGVCSLLLLMGVSVLGKGVPNAVNTYPGHTTHQTFCSGSQANGNVALLGFLLSWGKLDNK